jgi:hypothetical protein
MSPATAYTIAIVVAAVTFYGVARFFARGPAPDAGLDSEDAEGPSIRVVSRLRFGRGRELVIVETEGRRILLGSTNGQWSALADLGASRQGFPDDPLSAFEAELTRAMNPKRFGRGRRTN